VGDAVTGPHKQEVLDRHRSLQSASGNLLDIHRFSLITVWADGLARDAADALRPNVAAWYSKSEPTFSDAIAAVRRVLWAPPNFSMSRQTDETITIATGLLNRVFQTLCLAA
jgi:hypothetical protein